MPNTIPIGLYCTPRHVKLSLCASEGFNFKELNADLRSNVEYTFAP